MAAALLVALATVLTPLFTPAHASLLIDQNHRVLLSQPMRTARPAALPALDQFRLTLENGQPKLLVGIYVPGVMALSVSQQPAGQPGYVSSTPDTVTQFNLAAGFNTLGLLAHNSLAGKDFSKLAEQQEVILIYGDGSLKYYSVIETNRYQALNPYSPFSDFLNLDRPGKKLSATQLFKRIYGPGNRLVFQTCIEANGNPSWGRLFITAVPISQEDASHKLLLSPIWQLLE